METFLDKVLKIRKRKFRQIFLNFEPFLLLILTKI